MKANPLVLFVMLQVLDVLTTMAVFGLGGGEMNPVVTQIMSIGPLRGLLASKLIVVAIAAACVYIGKQKGIRLANIVFAAVVVWNCSIVARLMIA